MEKTAKVLVLGGTGIIGRELTKILIDQDRETYVVSRRGGTSSSPRLHYIAADARDMDGLRSKLADHSFDTVIDLLSFDKDQMLSTLELVKDKCSQYIFISSATVYKGNGDGQQITESSPRVDRGWNYPLQKLIAEEALQQAAQGYGVNYTIVRPYITYSGQRISFGEWEGYDIVKTILDDRPIVIGDELADSVTTLTHSHDLAVGIAGLIMNDMAMNDDFHITSDESMTWREVFEVAAEIVGKKPNIIDVPIEAIKRDLPELAGKIEDRCMGRSFSNAKLKQALGGFDCKYTVKTGYSELINDYLKRGRLVTTNHLQQGKMDRFVARYGSKQDREKLKSYRRSIRRESLKNYGAYMAGYNKMLFYTAQMLIKAPKRLRGIKDNYAVS